MENYVDTGCQDDRAQHPPRLAHNILGRLIDRVAGFVASQEAEIADYNRRAEQDTPHENRPGLS